MLNKKLISFFILILFTGCQNVYKKENENGQVTGGMVKFITDTIDTIYPFLGFFGLIILGLAINTLFIKNINSRTKFVMGFTELIIAILLIISKSLSDGLK